MQVFEYKDVVELKELADDGLIVVPASAVAACGVTTDVKKDYVASTGCVYVECRGRRTVVYSSDAYTATFIDSNEFKHFDNHDGRAVLPWNLFKKFVGNKPKENVLVAVRTTPDGGIDNKTTTEAMLVEVYKDVSNSQNARVLDVRSQTFYASRGLVMDQVEKFMSAEERANEDVTIDMRLVAKVTKVFEVAYQMTGKCGARATMSCPGRLKPVRFEKFDDGMCERTRVVAMPCNA